MNIPLIISVLGEVPWLIIPFRQAKTNYFLYFLIYAINSAFMFMVMGYILPIHPAYLYLGLNFFLIVSLFDFKKIPHYLLFLTGVLIVSIILPFLISIRIITLCLVIQHAVIFFIILKRTIIYSYHEGKLNLFQFVLLLYEITIVTRFLVVLHNIKTNIIYFYLTGAFSILISIFFLFYNVENSPKIRMTSKDFIDN